MSSIILPKEFAAKTEEASKSKPLRRRMTMRLENGKRSETFVTVDHKGADPKQVLLYKIGEIPENFVQFTRILVAIYAPPVVNKTDGGILLTAGMTEEDLEENKTQGKVGLIIAMGSRCYEDDDTTKFHDIRNSVGDWVWFRPTDGMPCEINGTLCRVFREDGIIGKVPHPDAVW